MAKNGERGAIPAWLLDKAERVYGYRDSRVLGGLVSKAVELGSTFTGSSLDMYVQLAWERHEIANRDEVPWVETPADRSIRLNPLDYVAARLWHKGSLLTAEAGSMSELMSEEGAQAVVAYKVKDIVRMAAVPYAVYGDEHSPGISSVNMPDNQVGVIVRDGPKKGEFMFGTLLPGDILKTPSGLRLGAELEDLGNLALRYNNVAIV